MPCPREGEVAVKPNATYELLGKGVESVEFLGLVEDGNGNLDAIIRREGCGLMLEAVHPSRVTMQGNVPLNDPPDTTSSAKPVASALDDAPQYSAGGHARAEVARAVVDVGHGLPDEATRRSLESLAGESLLPTFLKLRHVVAWVGTKVPEPWIAVGIESLRSRLPLLQWIPKEELAERVVRVLRVMREMQEKGQP